MEKIVKNYVENPLEKPFEKFRQKVTVVPEASTYGKKIGVKRNWQVIITATLSMEPIHRVTSKLIVTASWKDVAEERALKEYRNMHKLEPKMLMAPLEMRIIPLEEVMA